MCGTTLAILAVLLGHTFSAPAENPPPARVFVYTALSPSGLSSEEEQGRLDSVRDLQEALSRRKSDFALVKTADEADVVVEVLNREEREMSEGGFGGASVSRFRETILRLRVKSGTTQSEVKGFGRPSWKAAAKDAAERLAKWVQNRGR